MIEKIRGISIKGRCYTDEKVFKFYPNENDRISVVYGKNGSGKSTISEGFNSIAKNLFPIDLSARLMDDSLASIELDNNGKIFVFDENYIDENVKIDDDGLGTIILLGGQVDLQAEIDQYTEFEKSVKAEYDVAQIEYNDYGDESNPMSPEFHRQRIKKALQTGWAVKDAEIKGNKINSKVSDSTITEICNLVVVESIAQLEKEYLKTRELLEKVSDASVTYPMPVKKVEFKKGFEIDVCALLGRVIEKPILTEREKLILTTIQEGKQTFVEEAKRDFGDGNTDICPYCYRPIDEEYRRGLIESINRVLNKDVDNHRAELCSIQFPTFAEEYSSYAALDRVLVDEIVRQQKICIEVVSQYKGAINQKENNVYTPIDYSLLGLEGHIKKLNQLLEQLEDKRQEFVDAVKRRNLLLSSLVLLNKKIACVQVNQIYKDYLKQTNEREKAEKNLREKHNKYKEIVEYLEELQQKKSDVRMAINGINNALDYVFFNHGRLAIELRNEKYYLKSNGKDVRPKNVSIGERNIIALCYFFTQILSNQDVNKLYQAEELIVIDDPVSSFDFENRVGILSFIRYQINRIIKGNPSSKILVFSHDLATVFDFNKAVNEICQGTKGIANVSPTTYSFFELANGTITSFTKRRTEYGVLLENIYYYANGDVSGNGVTIGNTMRRALEVFSTFTYRKSIEDVLMDAGVLETLGKKSIYFENLMCRLVLHGESHFEEQVYNLHDDANFYQFISDAEKQRTARDILCFMYILNCHHVKAYLNTVANAVKNISSWVKCIPDNTSFDIKRNEVGE